MLSPDPALRSPGSAFRLSATAGPRECKAGAGKRTAGEGERKAGAGDSTKRRKAYCGTYQPQVPITEPRYRNYFSQNKLTCGEAIEIACGPVSVANSLIWRGVWFGGILTPLNLIHLAWGVSLPREAVGLSPVELCELVPLLRIRMVSVPKCVSHATTRS